MDSAACRATFRRSCWLARSAVNLFLSAASSSSALYCRLIASCRFPRLRSNTGIGTDKPNKAWLYPNSWLLITPAVIVIFGIDLLRSTSAMASLAVISICAALIDGASSSKRDSSLVSGVSGISNNWPCAFTNTGREFPHIAVRRLRLEANWPAAWLNSILAADSAILDLVSSTGELLPASTRLLAASRASPAISTDELASDSLSCAANTS